MAQQHAGPERIGHRGAPREFPENTLPGFFRAVDRGADAVELDVHKTRDGRVVIHHDGDVRRPDGSLVSIAELTFEELQSIPLPDAARVPTLDEVMQALGDDATIYVEIKGAAAGEAAVAVARMHGRRFAFHSFDRRAVLSLRRRHPDLAFGVLFDEGTRGLAGHLDEFPVRDLWPHRSLVDRALVEAAHAGGKRVLVWTVNQPEEARRLAALGVDGLCGDDVRVFGGLDR